MITMERIAWAGRYVLRVAVIAAALNAILMGGHTLVLQLMPAEWFFKLQHLEVRGREVYFTRRVSKSVDVFFSVELHRHGVARQVCWKFDFAEMERSDKTIRVPLEKSIGAGCDLDALPGGAYTLQFSFTHYADYGVKKRGRIRSKPFRLN